MKVIYKGIPDNGRTANERGARLIFALLVVSLFSAAYHLEDPQPGLLAKVPTPEDPDASFMAEDTAIPDFTAILDVEMKKQTFFDFLAPYIERSNMRILQQRERLLSMVEKVEHGVSLTRQERQFIRALSRDYELGPGNVNNLDYLNRLLRRVDVIPPSLALAQAANESAWGTSRFAQEGNNLFGQWCYSEGCGLVPNRRRASASHEVKAFETVQDAVHAYIMNLNTFPSYLGLRLIRESLRRKGEPIDGISLTRGLGSYSERGEEYIDELQAMIYYNRLLERDETMTQ